VTARGTGLLLAVMVVLAGYLWFAELRPRREAASAPTAAPLLAIPQAAVAQVKLEEEGRRVIAMRRNGAWLDEHGRRWREDAVASLVDTLGELRPVMVVADDPAEPAEYGLGPTSPRLEVASDDGRPVLRLEVGARNPAWTGLYARHAGAREVVLVGAILAWELDKLRQAAPEP
jgi:hypothetical protein